MNKKAGFTIIEISLVIGIAGLILIMAFVALPSLWASQRDAERRANVMDFISAVKTYQTNNSRGALPVMNGADPQTYKGEKNATTYNESDWNGLIQDYLLKGSSSLADPLGTIYEFRVTKKCTPATTATVGAKCEIRNQATDPDINSDPAPAFDSAHPRIYVVYGATCDGDTIVKTNSNRSIAALQVLERGKYCHNT